MWRLGAASDVVCLSLLDASFDVVKGGFVVSRAGIGDGLQSLVKATRPGRISEYRRTHSSNCAVRFARPFEDVPSSTESERPAEIDRRAWLATDTRYSP